MNDDAVIQVEHVSKKFCKNLRTSMRYGIEDIGRNMTGRRSRSGQLRKEEFWAFDDVSFEVLEGETLGLIGPNGAGKTTVLKLLNGIFWPDKGKITVKGRMGVLIDVGAGFHPMLTGRENVYLNAAILGMSRQEAEEKFDTIVEFADIGNFIDTPVKHYSSGMFVRLGFAVAVHCEPDILLVDEILAVGDEGFQHKCFNKIGELKQKGTTVILVSHNMHRISTFANRALLINEGTAHHFESVGDAVRAYSKLFSSGDEGRLEKIASGNERIQFYDVQTNRSVFNPGETFCVTLSFVSSQEYRDAEIDLTIYSGDDQIRYFQATNKAYNTTIDLPKGKNELSIQIEEIPMANSTGRIAIAIWSHARTEKLFWWRIPVEFTSVHHSTGRNFLKVRYEIQNAP